IRFIDGLKQKNIGDLHKGVQTENGITVRVYVDTKDGERKPFPLPYDRANRILYVAYLLKQDGHPAVIVSKDFLVRVKGEAIGLEVQDYENLKVSYDRIYKGYRKLDVSKRDIDTFFKDGFLETSITDFRPNEYALLYSSEQSSDMAKYNAATKRLE